MIIDNRVVEMQFDNRQFEKNVQTSMSTLDKLKQSLNLPGASKGLENINSAAKNINLGVIGSAAETVGLKFNAMYTMADQALRNIVNRVQHTGEAIVSALTIDPIKTGLQEYETQIGAVQTILANTQHSGTTLDQVNNALDTLNTYADKTIYNFTEMTRNIGTFTAAGVDLQTSVESIQGIANLAAVSGSTSQQASTAMYQLSQALSAGKVSLMDWNSVVNAGMGGKVFQDALIRTSELLGTGAEAAIKAHGSFRESLTQGEWLTTDVLTETLKQFAGAYSEADLMAQGFTQSQAKEIAAMAVTAEEAATKVKTFTQLWDTMKEAAQSGWTQTWEIIIGDFEESKEFLTTISDAVGEFINQTSETRNELLGGALKSPWKKFTEGLLEANVSVDSFQNKVRELYDSSKGEGAFDKLVEKEGSFEDACRSGKVSVDLLKNALSELKVSGSDLSGIKENLKFGDSSEDVKKVQQALQSLGYEFEKHGVDGTIGKETEGIIKQFQEMNGLKVTGIVDEATLAALEEASQTTNDLSDDLFNLIDEFDELGGREKIIESLKNIFKALGDIIKPIKEAFREIFPPATSADLISVIDKFKALTERMTISTETAENIHDAFKGVFSVISFGIDVVKTIGSIFFSMASKMLGFSGSLLDIAGSVGLWLTNITEAAKKNNILSSGLEKVAKVISTVISKISEFVSALHKGFRTPDTSGLFRFFNSLWNIVKSTGSVIIDTLSSVPSTIADIFGKGDIFEVLNSGLLTGIFLAVTKFTKTLNNGFDGVDSVLENVVGILDDVRGCFQAYQDQLKAGTLQKIATAIALLAASIFVISTIDPNKLGQALGAISILFVELLGSLAIFNKMGGLFKGAIKAIPLMIALSTAILILAGAMKTLSGISWEGIAKGLIGVGVLMAELFVFMKFAKFDKNMKQSALGIVILSSALLILSKAVENFAGISWGGILKGLVAIGAFLAEVVVFSKFISSSSNMISAGAGLVLLAGSMQILSSAMNGFSSLSWGEIARGLVAMAGGLAAATIALNLIPKDSILRAAGLAVAAASLKILYDVLSELGDMTWEQMGKSVITIGAALKVLSIGLKAMTGTLRGSAALVVASLGLAVIAPVMKILSGLEWIGIAKGLTALAGSLAVFGIAGMLLSPIVPALLGLSAAFLMLGAGMVGIGAGLALIGVGISSLAFAFAAGATSIVASLSTIILGLLNLVPEIAEIIGRTILEVAAILGDYAPQLAESLCKLIVGVVDSLATYTPQLIDSLLTLLIGVINGLAEHTPALIQAFVNLFAKVFEGLVSAMNDIDTDTLLKGVGAVGIMSILAHVLAGVAKIIPSAMIGLLGVGLLLTELSLILAAIGGIAQIPGLKWLVQEGGDLLESVGNAIGRGIGGLISGIGEGISNGLPKIGENVSKLMEHLGTAAEHAKGIKTGSFSGVSELIDVIGDIALSTVGTSLSDIFTFGGTSMEKFQKDGVAFFNAMRHISYASAGITIDETAVSGIISAATELSKLQSTLEPIGGLVDWFTGRDDLSYFGMNAAAFMSSMKTALKSLNNVTFNTDALNAIITASKELSALRSVLEPIGGVVDWFTGRDDLGTFGDNVAEYMSSMKLAMSDLNGTTVNTEALSAIISASSELSKLQSSLESVGGVVDWFTGRDDLSTFGYNAGSFIQSMAIATSSLDGVTVNTEALSAIIESSIELSELQSTLEHIGGVIDWFIGRDDLGKFGANAATFILAMKNAMGSLDGVTINTEAMSAITTAATELSKLQSTLEHMGGVIDWFIGRDDLGTFGVNAAAFILSMKLAMGSLDNESFNSEAMSAIISAATELADLQSTLEHMGGVIDWFIGRDDLGNFGINAASFIRSMKLAMGSLDNASFNTEAMTAIITAATELSKLQSSLESVGGVIDWFTGRDDLGTFGVNAGTFIWSMKKAVSSLDGVTVNTEAMTAIITASKELSKLQSSLNSIGGVIDWFTGRDDLGNFGVNVGIFILAMKTAMGSLDDTTFNTEALSAIISASTELSKLQSSLNSIGGVIDWFTGRDDLATFGINIASFIRSMKLAMGLLDDASFNTEAMSSIISAATELSKLQSTLEPIGGVIDWFTGRDDLGRFGVNAAAFILSMSTAMSGLDGVTFNTEALAAIITASAELSKLQTSLESVGGVVDWFTGRDDLATFGVNSYYFISAMAEACSTVGEYGSVDGESLSAIITAASKLSELQSSLDSLGGVIGWFTGEQNLADFGTNASTFISAMAEAFGALGDTKLDSESMSAVVTAATELATLESSLDSMGGVISFFTGKKNLGDFGDNIKLFAEAMSKLKTGMGENGITEDVVTSVVNAGNALVELNNALPEEGFFDKKITMSDFSTYVSDFSTALSDFSTSASSLSAEGIDVAINTAERLKSFIDTIATIDTSGVASFTGVGVGGVGADGAVSDIADAMASFSTKVSGIDESAVSTATSVAIKLKSLINGIVELDTSGIESFKKISEIGSSINSYANKVADIDTSVVGSSITAANRLKNFINSLTDLDSSGISNFKVGTIGNTIKTYASTVAGVDFSSVASSVNAGNKLKNFINGLSGIDSSGVGTFTKAINDLGTVSIDKVVETFSAASGKLKESGSNMVEAIATGFKSKRNSLTNVTASAINDMVKKIDSAKAAFKVRGIEIMSQFVNGISSQRNRVSTVMGSAAASGAQSARNYYGSFFSAGAYLVNGFCAGISANTFRAAAQAAAMANAAENAARAALDIHSPSKVFASIGAFVVKGFVKGIDDNMNESGMAVRSMAEVAREGFATAMKGIDAIVNSDMDIQPTITPVLDLSNVRSGVGSINNMLGLSSTIGVNANVGAVSAMMSNRVQNGGESEVVSAINKLGKSLGNMGNTTYNVNGVNASDDAAVVDAVKTLIRAAKIERRV